MKELARDSLEAYHQHGLLYVILAGARMMLDYIERSTVKKTRLAHFYYIKKYEREALKACRNLANRGVGENIHEVPLNSYTSSDTVFLLGSGSSINDISESFWGHISKHDSIGLNKWPMHEFVPTFLVAEIKNEPGNEQYTQEYFELLRTRIEDYATTPIILKNTTLDIQNISLGSIPEELRGEFVISADSIYYELTNFINPITANNHLLRYLKQKGRFEPGPPFVLYRKRASISYLIHLAIKLEYQTIVLCGVDMINSKYFFDEIDSFTDKHQDSSKIHRTNDPDLGVPTLETIIYQMNELILKPANIELYVQNTTSKLYPRLPLYTVADDDVR